MASHAEGQVNPSITFDEFVDSCIENQPAFAGPFSSTASSTWLPPSPSSSIDRSQTKSLPNIVPTLPPHVSIHLDEFKDLDDWKSDVEKILKQIHLLDLIQNDVPRPKSTRPEFTKWEFLSEMVREWLYNQLSATLANRVRESHYPQRYADDVYSAIQKVVIGHGHQRCKEMWANLHGLRREDYESTMAYIDDFQHMFDLAEKLHIAPTPYASEWTQR
ncbi:hypothetical protein BO94DRAFT_240199 [Aspergillus sclerotioniger CBS 115572]|uniref:Uncharacterized protein n=1 Tax=Aspergillus sclerotioniger CBS 115572 TaxID=1450535 RepID=A0A317VIU0_9EURO|nr:hypothetical protein BO94DRAFT_240199 [Aspergillus sclerotioniger CBS 115572]PWY73107.1 hypothetical protein BO94DRAFT_240199 [Aspergillus sclerotioniger CBS 115572]